jgi:hypothetical protein
VASRTAFLALTVTLFVVLHRGQSAERPWPERVFRNDARQTFQSRIAPYHPGAATQLEEKRCTLSFLIEALLQKLLGDALRQKLGGKSIWRYYKDSRVPRGELPPFPRRSRTSDRTDDSAL